MEPMKILVYTRNFLPDMGGLERNTLTLATALTEMGHDVTVLTETMGEDERAFPFRTVRSRSRQAFFSEIKRADFVFVNGGLAMKICAICLFLGKKYVPIYQMSSLYLRDRMSFFSKKTRRFMAGRARMSVTVSHHAKGLLGQMLPGHTVAALPNPIDGELVRIAEKKAGLAVEKTYDLLFVGRLIDGKGIFDLIDAVANLRPRLDLKVAFAGDGEHKTALWAHAKERQLDVLYLGRLDREQLIEAYLNSKALVVPSSTHTEGNPLVIAEALSLGVPVIASDQAAMVEAVGGAGYVFKRGSIGDLSEKIEMLFEKNHLAEKSGNTAERKNEFSGAQYEARLVDILEKING